MDYALVKAEKQKPVGTIWLNRPEKLNALTSQLRDEVEGAAEEFGRDPEVKVLVIRGAGRSFCAGNDLERGLEGGVDDDRLRLQRNLERWLKLWDLPKPVIAMVHGHCLGIGVQLALCCDMAFVAEDAVIGVPSIPAGGGYVAQSWVWAVGPARAKYMEFLSGSRISGKVAEAWGWAARAFPADTLEQETYRYARAVAKVPADLLHLKKLSINRAMELQGFRATLTAGAEWDAIAHATRGAQEIRQRIEEHGLKATIEWYQQG